MCNGTILTKQSGIIIIYVFCCKYFRLLITRVKHGINIRCLPP